MMLRAKIATSAVLILVACGENSDADRLISEITEAGDTITMTTRGEPVAARIDSVEVVWQSPELENPRAMVATGGRLVVADPRRLHFLSDAGEHVRSVGRRGAGPGEFGSIAALASLGSVTVAVYDSRHQRISYFTDTGEYLESTRITPVSPYVNAVGPTFAPLRSAVTMLGSELVHTDRPTRTALVWHDLAADTATVLASWDGERFVDYGGMFAPSQLLGPRVIAAIGASGRLAVGDGVEYCVRIHSLQENAVRKACRIRELIPVGDGIRNPDLSVVQDEARSAALGNVIRGQEIGETMPNYDQLLVSPDGQLWVRTLGAELANLHPYLSSDMPEREPRYRTWDVFDVTGRLVGAVEMPSKFTPQTVKWGRVFGFLELATGEVAIGAASVPSME